MAYDVPAQDANPENLLAICRGLTDGSLTVKGMEDSEDIDVSSSVISDTVKYGIRLGFLEKDENEKVSLTDRGWEIAFEEEITDAMGESFKHGIQDHPLYSDLIEKTQVKGLVSENESEAITQKQILPLLNSDFGFSDLSSSSTLKPATNTFLRTLEAAGYGDYVIGRGDKPTRIELEEELETEATGITKSEEEDEQRRLADSEDDKGDQSQQDSPENDSLEEANSDEREAESDIAEESKKTTQDLNRQIKDNGAEVSINIEISSEDWSSSEVIELINSLRKEGGD